MNLNMASHCLFYKNDQEFDSDFFEDKNPILIRKLAKSILFAIKRKKKEINVFEAFFKNETSLVYNVKKKGYEKSLIDCIPVLVSLDTVEDYLLCAEILKGIERINKNNRIKESQRTLLQLN
jgi:hypothetical protein